MTAPPRSTTGPDGERLSDALALAMARARNRVAAEAREDAERIKTQSTTGCHQCRDLDHTSPPYCRCPCHDKGDTR